MYINAEVGFLLNGRLLPIHSIVLFSDIGEDSSALYCLTDREQCCSDETGGRHGQWMFPEGGDVSNNKNIDIYIRRGFSSIRLNRKRNIMMPTGVYMCLIPDSNSTSNRILRIGIYSNGSQGNLVCMYMQGSYASCDFYIHCRVSSKGVGGVHSTSSPPPPPPEG